MEEEQKVEAPSEQPVEEAPKDEGQGEVQKEVNVPADVGVEEKEPEEDKSLPDSAEKEKSEEEVGEESPSSPKIKELLSLLSNHKHCIRGNCQRPMANDLEHRDGLCDVCRNKGEKIFVI